MVYHNGIPTILVHQILQIPIRIPEVCPTQEVPPELGRNQLWRARSACARWDSSFGPWTESDPEKVKANVSWSPGASKLPCSLPSPRYPLVYPPWSFCFRCYPLLPPFLNGLKDPFLISHGGVLYWDYHI